MLTHLADWVRVSQAHHHSYLWRAIMSRKTIYLASPLGFATATHGFMAELAGTMREVIDVLNPWDNQRFADEFVRLRTEDSVAARDGRLAKINTELGRKNTESIDAADGVFAILDGVDVDSGT